MNVLDAVNRQVDHGMHVLKSAPIKVFGMKAHALLDTGAVLNILSKYICGNLAVSREDSKKNITVTTDATYAIVRILRDVRSL